MHDIWNPWHGCVKKSEGCLNCYMYAQDRMRNADGGRIYKVKNKFDYPVQTDGNGRFKIKSGETLRVCMTSDFFLEEADEWRADVWKMIKERSDVFFMLLTKRPERVGACLPDDWNGGYENVFFNVTCENQKRADERLPLLLSLPFKHKGVVVAPFIGEVSLEGALKTGQIKQVVAGGENYDGLRPLRYEWVKRLFDECVRYDTTFCFTETGTNFIKDGKIWHIPDKRKQSVAAFRSGLQYKGREMPFVPPPEKQLDLFGAERDFYKKKFTKRCDSCGSRLICNGCSDCGACGLKKQGK